ncbi:unnamed protein product [Polarella glacialis]|uniref:FYVE-type domain-containing protein n=1 Tax=Polarella glacialis TaxID=89957 RepID=A0A813JPS5_POLGL|nr:unnamed protein product [Polarella glacialis]
MSFASYARWATCRNAHCSSWARNLNMKLRMHRGLASSPILRLAAEPRPLEGFVEQRSAVAGLTNRLCAGEDLDENSGGVAAAQAIAAILDGIANLDTTMSCRLSEMLDLSAPSSAKCSGSTAAVFALARFAALEAAHEKGAFKSFVGEAQSRANLLGIGGSASSSSTAIPSDGTRCEGCGTAFGMLTRRQRCGSCDRSLCGSCLGSSLAVVGISCLCGSTCPQCRVLGERSGEFEKCRRLMEDGVSVTLGLPKKGGLFGAAADRRKLPVWLTLKCCGQVAELSWGSLEQRAGRPAEEGHFSVSEVLAVRNTGILLELSIKGQMQATTLDFGTPAERDAWSRYIDLALEVLTPECERGDRDVARADHRRGEIEERRCLNEDRKKKLQENLGMRFTAEAMLSRGSKG